MLVRRSFLLIGFLMAPAVFSLMLSRESPAQDVRHMCSEKYQAAKAAGTLNGEAWPQFYSKCTAEAKGNPPAAAAAPAAAAPHDVRHVCSEKYQAAKAAGTLNGEAWPQFYSKCTAEAKGNPPAATATPPAAAPAPRAPVVAAPPPTMVPAPVVAAPAPPPTVAPPAAPVVTPHPVNPLKTPASKPMAPAVAPPPSTAIFPSAISPAHAGEKPYLGRLKTCADQFKANKATNANGGLKWIQKGDGYWSECNKHLKG